MTTIITDQKISEMIPKTLSVADRDRVRVVGVEDRLHRVERARADVAEDDAERADEQRPFRGAVPARRCSVRRLHS